MKILKPGKVEQRKFTCPKCGCVFVASAADLEEDRYCTWAVCPQNGCEYSFNVSTDNSEPYEEPVQSDMDRLITVLYKNWAMDDEFADSVAQTLIANGVTFREG